MVIIVISNGLVSNLHHFVSLSHTHTHTVSQYDAGSYPSYFKTHCVKKFFFSIFFFKLVIELGEIARCDLNQNIMINFRNKLIYLLKYSTSMYVCILLLRINVFFINMLFNCFSSYSKYQYAKICTSEQNRLKICWFFIPHKLLFDCDLTRW